MDENALTRLRGRLLQGLAEIPGMNDPAQRDFLLEQAGYGYLAEGRDRAGSASSFFTSVIGELAASGLGALADFMVAVTAATVVGVDRRAALDALAKEASRLTPSDLASLATRSTRVAALRARARENTVREIAEIGSKYLRDLYFRHEELERHVEEFTVDDTTCLLVVAKAGRGKTNLLCSLAERCLDESFVLFMSARVPVVDSYGLLSLIAARLGYGEDWPSCFADLAQLVQPMAAAPLLLLDAINESPASPKIMKAAIQELLRQAQQAGLKVVVTCRTDFWQFYRASFWSGYVGHRGATQVGPVLTPSSRVEDVPLFPVDALDGIVGAYFAAFQIQGELRDEAAERCRHALVLRMLCEAYRGRDMGVIESFRLFSLFKLFWDRKVEQVADTTLLKGKSAVAELLLEVARLMRTRRSTTVPRSAVAEALGLTSGALDSSDSLYSRVIDEELILEENVDDELGLRNVVFIYDRFAEYVLALSLFLDYGWTSKDSDAVVADALALMTAETGFASLRGALEFLVMRLEDRRCEEQVDFAVVRSMLARDWKWRGIGVQLIFQLDPAQGEAYWQFLWEVASSKNVFVRRSVAEQLDRVAQSGDERSLQLLNKLMWDDRSVVQLAAHRSLLRLPDELVLPEAQLLLSVARPDSAQLAAHLLIGTSFSDPHSAFLRAVWLTEHFPKPSRSLTDSLQAVLVEHRELAYAEAPVMSAFEAGFRSASAGSIWSRPLAKQLRSVQARRTKELQDDCVFVRKLCTLMRRMLDADGFSGDLWNEDEAVAKLRSAPRSETPVARREDASDVRMGTSMVGLAWRHVIENSATPSHVVAHEVLQAVDLHTVIDLWLAWNRTTRELDEDGGCDDWTAFSLRLAKTSGHEMSEATARAIHYPEQLAIWLWQSGLRKQERLGTVDRLASEMVGRTADSLAGDFELFQREIVPDLRQLTDRMLALCTVLRERPQAPAQALGALVIWHEDHDSQVVQIALDEVFWSEPDSFWFLVQSLLNHPDQRVVNAAARAGENAARLEEVGESDIRRDVLAELAGIVEEISGVERANIRLGADFVNELKIDSLTAIEIVVASEELFGIRISDNDIQDIRTVGEAVDYIVNAGGGSAVRNIATRRRANTAATALT